MIRLRYPSSLRILQVIPEHLNCLSFIGPLRTDDRTLSDGRFYRSTYIYMHNVLVWQFNDTWNILNIISKWLHHINLPPPFTKIPPRLQPNELGFLKKKIGRLTDRRLNIPLRASFNASWQKLRLLHVHFGNRRKWSLLLV